MQRAARVSCRRRQAVQEKLAFGGVLNQRENFLELVDDQQDLTLLDEGKMKKGQQGLFCCQKLSARGTVDEQIQA
jgi:hypothetical protein